MIFLDLNLTLSYTGYTGCGVNLINTFQQLKRGGARAAYLYRVYDIRGYSHAHRNIKQNQCVVRVAIAMRTSCAHGYSHAHKDFPRFCLTQNENILGLKVVTTPTQPQHTYETLMERLVK